jgi:hypothetical protein
MATRSASEDTVTLAPVKIDESKDKLMLKLAPRSSSWL